MTSPQALARGLQLFQRAQSAQASADIATAADCYRQALGLLPNHPAIVAGYAALAEQVKDWAAAEKLYRHLGQLRPDSNFEPRLALALFRQGRYAECVPLFSIHLQRHPGDADVLHAQGLALCKLKRWEEALECGRRLESIVPDARAADLVLNSLFNLGRGDELDPLVESALARFPDSPDVQSLCGVHLLKRGHIARGFAFQRAIRWRYDKDKPDPRHPPADWWDGRPFDGTLLVAGEQGLGEEILASCMFRDLLDMGQRTVVECEPRLLPVFRRSFPDIAFVPRWQGELERVATAGGTCRRIKSLDLAYFLRRNETPAQPTAWLQPDAQRVEQLRAEARARWPGRRLLGVSWRSSREFINGPDKSMPVLALAPLLARADLACIDLQYGEHAADIDTLRHAGIEPPWQDDGIDARDDLDGLLAQLCALDGLVTVSNSTAHLAAAAGVTTHLLLPHARPVLWYWGYAGKRTPWYPTVRAWRNAADGNWQATVDRLARSVAGGEHHDE